MRSFSISIPWQVRLHLNSHERVTPLPHSTFDPGGAVETPYTLFFHSLTRSPERLDHAAPSFSALFACNEPEIELELEVLERQLPQLQLL